MEDLGSSHTSGLPAYIFGNFRLEPDGTLLRGEKLVKLSEGELACLRLLIEQRGNLVSLAQLGQAMENKSRVSDENVNQAIASLRKHLGAEGLFKTVPNQGFRFTNDVQVLAEAQPAALPHIAMLPLVTEFGVAEYLGIAVTEGAMDRLARRKPAVCTLAAEESVATLARRGLSAVEIGRAMHADMVLTGSLRVLPTHHRMRAEMIDVENGLPIWTEDVIVERSRVAGLETELARLISFRLEGESVTISASAEHDEAEADEPVHREAHELYQRARFEWQSLERHRMQDAVQHLTRAGELDPSLAAARIDLAHLAITEAYHGYLSPAIAVDMVRRATRQGFENIPGHEAILPAVGWIDFHYDRNLRSALDAFARSAHLPHDPWITRARVMLDLSRRRFEESAQILQHALHSDPYSSWLHARLAWTYHMMGDAAASTREINASLLQFPLHEGVELYAGIILAFNGEVDRAVKLARALEQRRPYFDPAVAVHAYALAVAGQNDEALSILDRLEWMGRERYVMTSLSAAVYLVLGDRDRALTELETANEARCPWFFQALADPRLAPLHDAPKFRALDQILGDLEHSAKGN